MSNCSHIPHWSWLALACTTLTLLHPRPSLADTDTALSPFLQNMPMNREHRCVGIAAVSESLLEGKRYDSQLSIDELARSIHRNLSRDERIEFPSQLELRGHRVAVEDKAVLSQLSIKVADLYKEESKQAWRTPHGAEQLTAAKRAVVRTRRRLHRILEEDRDNTEFFCCFGKRRFPDGTYKDTYHAAVFQLTDYGNIVVFDSNEPGKPFHCKLEQTVDRLTVEWTCKYRDTGMVTTQRYELVPKSTFFRIARGIQKVQVGRP